MNNNANKLAHLTPEQKRQLAQKLKAKKKIHLFPLSHAQQRMWFLDRLTPGSPAYNLPFAITIKGKLDRELFDKSIKTIIKRHETLRTTFKEIKDEVRQVTAPISAIKIEFPDLYGCTADELVRKSASQSFDLEKGPLGVISLIKTGTDEHVMIMVMHHIISDGWSMGVLIREFSIIYDALLTGKQPNLEPLKIQYADYAQWQKKWLKGERLEQQLSFWRKSLTSTPPVLELNGDKPRTRQLSNRGAQIYHSLNKVSWQRLKTMAGRNGLTDFMLLLGTFYLLLNRYTRQDDICIGTPVANRNRAETEALIGLFVNTLVLRCSISEEASLTAFFKKIKETALNAFAHQDIPFEMLVQELHPVRDMGHSPLFQAFFTHTPGSGELTGLSGLTFKPVSLEVTTAKFELSLFTQETNDGLDITFEYNSDLYSGNFIRRLTRHFVKILDQLASGQPVRISDLELLNPDERRQILEEWNHTEQKYREARPLLTLFEEQAHRSPENIALRFQDREISYKELNDRATELAAVLQSHGVGSEQFVGLYMERAPELVIAMYAILKSGAAYVPLDPDYPEERLRYMLNDSQTRVVITQKYFDGAELLKSRTVIIADEPDSGDAVFHDPVGNVDQAAYMIYTSGSTGRPKGVVITHRAIWNRLQWMQETFPLQSGERVVQKTSYSFDVSVWEFFWPLQYGATLVLAKPGGHKEAVYLQRLIAQEKISTIHFVPSMLQAFLNSVDISTCPSLKRVICSGEALSPELVQQFYRASNAELHNLYGPTEAAVDVSNWSCSASDAFGSTPIGRPIANTHIYIVDNHLHLQPVGVAGELLIAGVQLARAYHHRPALTAEKFIPNAFGKSPGERLYRTGDLARFMENGAIEFLGRIDHQVKLRGLRIELGEIENALKSLSVVDDAVVLIKSFGADDQRLVAYVQAKSGMDTGFLQKELYRYLPDYMVPALFVLVDAIPLSPSGKANRRTLLAMKVTIARNKEYVAPRNKTEKVIATIFKELLDTDKVGALDSFFDLGGHSLLATRLISRIRDIFKVELEVRTIFDANTVESLAMKVDGKSGIVNAGQLPPITRIKNNDQMMLSFSQQRLWFLDQLEPGSPNYNIPVVIRAVGPFNRDAFTNALERIMERQEVFRTAFVTKEGKPFLIIEDRLSLPLTEDDFSVYPQEERDNRIRDAIFKDARRSFNLAKAPLFHIHIIKISEQESVILINMHHIISDGWSVSIFLSEIAHYYAHYETGETLHLPELPIQFKDYAVWQRSGLKGDILKQHGDYWYKQLSGAPALLELPTDRPRPAVQGYSGAHLNFKLSPQVSRTLNVISRQSGLTLFMTTLGLFKIILSKYSGQKDICVGTPIANRTSSKVEHLIGFFVNTLVMRSKIDSHLSLLDFLLQVRQTAFDAYAHQNLPFEKVVDVVDPVRDPSHTPLFQVMFALQNQPHQDIKSADLQLSFMEVENHISKFDLTLNLTESPEQIIGDIEYNTDLFDRDTIEALANHFCGLTERFTTNPDISIASVELLTAGEVQKIVTDWNTTDVDFDLNTTLPDLFAIQAQKTPDVPAVLLQGQKLSYAEVNERSNRMAHYLLKKGLHPGQIVAVYMPRSMEAIICLWAIMKAGGVYLPLDPFYPPGRIAYMLEDSAASFCLIRKGMTIKTAGTQTINIDDADLFAPYPTSAPDRKIHPEYLAYIIYTSGSTGKPKGVMVEHRSALNLMYNLEETVYKAFHGKPQNISLNAPLPFDASMQQIVMMARGHCLTLIPDEIRADGKMLMDYIQKYKISVYDCVPSQLKLLLEAGLLDTNDFKPRALLPGGEALDVIIWKTLRETPDIATFNMYGPTECTVDSTMCALKSAGDIPVIGRPLANAAFYVLDTDIHPVPIGVTGELYIAGSGLARGYLNRSALTAEKFVPDPFSGHSGARMYRTGDLVRYQKDGNLRFIGRVDHQVKLRGFRIELGEIESRLRNINGVNDALVLVREDAPGLQRLVTYLIAEKDDRPSIGAMRNKLKTDLPDYMVPAVFIWLEVFPLTPNKKIDVKALPLPDNIRPELETRFVAPSTENEKILAQIVCDVLKLKQVGIHDNFFELGGDSIMSIQVISRATQQGLKITPLQMFQNQSIALLAGIAKTAPVVKAEQGLVSGTAPLAPIQKFFFEQSLANENHWNQSVLLDVADSMDRNALLKAIDALLWQHDALRLRFKKENDRIVSWFSTDIHAEKNLSWLETDIDSAEQGTPKITLEIDRLQASLDIRTGPLFRVAYFKCGTGDDHLLLVIHHLAMDGVSWRILLEDLQLAYTQATKDGKIILPAKSTSYKKWTETLWQNNIWEKHQTEKNFWLALAQKPPVNIYAKSTDGNIESKALLQTIQLDTHTTNALLTDVHKAFNTQINDILLTALLRAFSRWNGGRRILLHLESHGRETLADDIDISRTVGWFTSIYPVYLEFHKAVTISDQIKTIKEQLGHIPHNGLGFGLFRYGYADNVELKQLKKLDDIQILYNYLGQFTSDESQASAIRPSRLSRGAERAAENKRTALLEINGSVVNGALSVSFGFTPNQFAEDSIKRFAEAFLDEIKKVIDYCKNPVSPSKSASDFKMAGLKNKNLDNVLKQLGKKKR